MVNPSPTVTAEKSRGRRAHQEVQRIQTRARLLDAARKVFAGRDYQSTTIEHVLTEAKVSRAAYYAHFESKLALVLALAEQFLPEWAPLYEELAQIDPDDLPALERWTARHIELYRRNAALCTLLTQVATLEETLYRALAAQQDGIIRRLGTTIPAFRLACDDATMHARAVLLLSHLDHACFLITQRRDELLHDGAALILAEKVQAFLKASPGRG